MDLKLVLCPHTTERFLLFVWGAVLFQHVRNEIHTIGKPLALGLSRLVLHSHTTERFLLLYGEVFLCQHVRFEIQGYCGTLKDEQHIRLDIRAILVLFPFKSRLSCSFLCVSRSFVGI